MAPELGVPGLVHCIQRAVFLSQPDTEGFLAVFTVAGSAVLVAHMPAFHMGIGGIALGKLRCQSHGILPEDLGVRAGIVALTEFVASALVVHALNLRIFSGHPGRKGSGGGGEHDVVILFAQHLDDLIQLGKIVSFLGGLDFCPGKYVDRGAVDAGILKNPHILLPNFLRPLIGVVIAPVQDTFDFFSHK